MLRLNCLEPFGGVTDGLVPSYFLPRVGDGFANHRIKHAIWMGGVAKSEATFNARMPFISPTILVGNHSDKFVTAHFGLEGASNTAVGASGQHGSGRHTKFNYGFFLQG
ncbi:unannotated protein [freshwater metagenome]|uniref:Unannotated protein n=1 Tax=freshwater metagenome TaxID=449393 RepID=A0A6J7PHW3_9ZZZZ